MNPAMWISKTGVQAQDAKLQAIANNLANVNTVGYKRDRVLFEDLRKLGKLIDMSPADLKKRLGSSQNFVWLRRQVPDEVAQKVAAFDAAALVIPRRAAPRTGHQ